MSGYQYGWRLPGKKWTKSSVNRNVRIVNGLKGGKTYQVSVRAYMYMMLEEGTVPISPAFA